jgi:hypothetical protein
MATVAGLCPPTNQTKFDMQGTASCVQTLTQLYQAYINTVSGTQRVVVRFGERWTEYNRASAPNLLVLYQTIYAQCPNAAASGLPDLNPSLRVKRGAPARGRLPRHGGFYG